MLQDNVTLIELHQFLQLWNFFVVCFSMIQVIYIHINFSTDNYINIDKYELCIIIDDTYVGFLCSI